MSEHRKLYGSVASFRLVFGNKDALGYEVVGCGRYGAAMGEFFYAVEAGGGHLVRGYEYGLRLSLTPLIETLIVEAIPFLDISVCAFVRDVAVYRAVFWYADLLVVEHRGCNRQVLPPPLNILADGDAVLCVASDATVFRLSSGSNLRKSCSPVE